jgi:hypothetical protein
MNSVVSRLASNLRMWPVTAGCEVRELVRDLKKSGWYLVPAKRLASSV